MNTAAKIAVSIPTSLVVLVSVAGATAQVTQADRAAVKRSLIVFGAALVVAAAISQDAAVGVATAATVGVAYYGLNWAFGGLA